LNYRRCTDRGFARQIFATRRRPDGRYGTRGAISAKNAVKADDSRHVSAAPREFQHAQSSEAETDRAEPLRVDARLCPERCEARVHAPAEEVDVAPELHHARSPLQEARRHASAAIHIGGEGDETALGELSRTAFCVIGDARALVHHENAGACPALRVGTRELTDESDATVCVLERLRFHAALIATPLIPRHMQ